MTNKKTLTKEQEKRFDLFFGTGGGRLDDEPEARWWSEGRVKAIKQHLADELSLQKKEIIEKLIVIRDVEKGEAKDLRKTRAGYNINLLIKELSNANN